MNPIDSMKEKWKKHNSIECRYERSKNTVNNTKARQEFQKLLSGKYANKPLTEIEQAILYTQAYHSLLLKNPADASFPDFNDYSITKTESTYIISGYCDATNSYGAQIRENHQYEVYKQADEWTCLANATNPIITFIVIMVLVILVSSFFI